MLKRSWNGSTDEWIRERHYTKDEIDAKLETINELLSLSTGGSVDSLEVTVEKQQTADTGYIATYVVKQGGNALSPKINIESDFNKQDISNIVTSWGSTLSDTKYPSEKLVKTSLNNIESLIGSAISYINL